ncbi:MAG: hypothetical protein JKX72_00315, partial [Robiginitomaculum sp.]|nr:hypothetical protein [Robiginitomaculum sp.]
YSIFENERNEGATRVYIARALLQIVEMSELEQRYLNDNSYKYKDKIGKEIRRAIQNKMRFIEQGINPC